MQGGSKVEWTLQNGSTTYGKVVGVGAGGYVLVAEKPQGVASALLLIHQDDLRVLELPAAPAEQPEIEPQQVPQQPAAPVEPQHTELPAAAEQPAAQEAPHANA